MKKWNYIIFDMDGTLFDTEAISLKAWMYIKEKFGYPITKDFCIQLIGRTRQSAQPIFQEYMPEHFDQDTVFKEHRLFTTNYKKQHGPLPKTDLHKLLGILKTNGYKLALCTSSKREVVDFNLAYEHLDTFFDVIVDGSMCEKGKPFPDLYLKTAELLQADVKDCLVIEDSKNGILSAHNAGMDVIMVIDLVQPDEEITSICFKIVEKIDEITTVL